MGYNDPDFIKRLFDSKNDSQWRAATELNRLSNELDAKGQEIYHWRMLVGRLAEAFPDIFPYPRYVYEQQRSVEEIRSRVDSYITQKAKEKEKA